MRSEAGAAEVPAIPGEIVKEAIRWHVRLHGGSDAALEQAVGRWRAADPRHDLAWRRLQHIDEGLSADLAATADPPRAVAVLERAGMMHRRQVLKLLALSGALAPPAVLAYRVAPWPQWMADLATASGELRALHLADGNLLQLDTATAVDLHFDATARQIALVRGGLRLSAEARAGLPPLAVRTRHARLTLEAARLVLRQEGTASRLDVEAGTVMVGGRGQGAAIAVHAGQGVLIGDAGMAPAPWTGLEPGAWAEGVIVARDARLADVVAEVARYRRGHLGCTPAVGDLRLSGVFQLADTDRLLAILARTLPVGIRYRSRWWVTVAEIA